MNYEWYETPYGKFRVEKRRFGTWSSFGEDGKSIVTGGTRESEKNISQFATP